MIIIEGFEPARAMLSREAPGESYPVSPQMGQRLLDMFGTREPVAVVSQIIDEVRSRGDGALVDYTLMIDGIRLTSLEVGKSEVAAAYRQVAPELLSALQLAAEQIRTFYTAQRSQLLGGIDSSNPGQLIRPLKRIGAYVPGGTAAYPSTVLMTAIPARVAGVSEVIMVTPPRGDGRVPPATLVAADLAGVDRIFSIGGAQAIAALAYGTASVPRVDKICGPGNIFVVLAKKLVYGTVDIDGLHGPSEVLIIADDGANPDYVVADLLAQAEHDPLASAILVTTSRRLAGKVKIEIEDRLKDLPRKDIAAECLSQRGIIAVVDSIDEALELANLYAPEHLCLMLDKAESYVSKVYNAGCIFIGEKSSVVFGDYVAGPSHVLPTGGTARFSSPLNILEFIKVTDLVNMDDAALAQLGRAASIIARAEGLEAHALAAEKRLKTG